jgi:hypothetical protein
MGPNVKKLVIRKMAMLMIPDGGGFSDGLRALCDNPSQYVKPATKWVEDAITAVRESPGEPSGSDEEIAGLILREMCE